MRIIGIIPARMGSSRFPGKPLAMLAGYPMIYHVYFRAKLSKILTDVFIATCDRKIEEYCLCNKINVIMTKDTHERASDRAAEAMLKIEKRSGKKIDIVVMIQGDEPMLFPEMVDMSVDPMLGDTGIKVVNLMAPIKDRAEHEDPNTVKVVFNQYSYALYFSREPIPSRKKGAKIVPMYKQVCIIPFRRDFLLLFNRLRPGILEGVESVDMLRVLEHGYKVKMILTDFVTYSVDNVEDLKKVEKLLKKDRLVKKYENYLLRMEWLRKK